MGARFTPDGVFFRVWAPKRSRVEVLFEDKARSVPLAPETGGFFSGHVPGVRPGTLYRYRLDGRDDVPDPYSRYQPGGPDGPSMVIDPDSFTWTDQHWNGVTLHGQIMYELHVGAFTPEGTFASAAERLPDLQALGVTLVELMPVSECPGRWNWGYDGVNLFAPSHNYGGHDALKRFVDRAHHLGIGVILDVVYNHIGPDGNYLTYFSDDYFTDRYENEWGDAINFDGPNAEQVREFFLQNACYWISEFHLDGLRLDATQNIYDRGPVHLLSELSRRTRFVAGERKILLIAENEPQDVACVAPVEKGGFGLDAIWNDDFHHASRVALTGRREAYFTDYRGSAQEFVSCLKRGFLFQGQYYAWQKKPRGTRVTNEPAAAFVCYLQNHDQIANCAESTRLAGLSNPAVYRALTALLLLAPATPLLFMGQEFAATASWFFFADHNPELAKVVWEGRRAFLGQFPSYATPETQETIPDPSLESTFQSSKLDWSERRRHERAYALHADLIRLRRADAVISRQSRVDLDGAILSDEAFVLRFFGGEAGERLLIINLGRQLEIATLGEPLLAPAKDSAWKLIWSTDAPRYGGPGVIDSLANVRWTLPPHCAMLFSSQETGGRAARPA